MICFSAYWSYIEEIRVSPENAIKMAKMSYHNGVLSLPDYLNIRNKLENKIRNTKQR